MGCDVISADFDRVIALQIDLSPRTVEAGDTLRLTATAVTAAGEVVPDAVIVWALLDVDSGQVGFTIDSSGLVTALSPGMGRVQARLDDLRSDPITVMVTAMPDSITAAGDTAITVPSTTATSGPLEVTVFDVSSEPGQPQPLADKSVRFELVEPVAGSTPAADFTLLDTSGDPGEDPHRLVVVTGGAGTAAVTVEVATGAVRPDSIIIHATGLTTRNTPVPGSPIRFVVFFPSAP